MPIGKEQVEHLENLTRLKISPTDIKKQTKELTPIVGCPDKLQDVDTQSVSCYVGALGRFDRITRI